MLLCPSGARHPVIYIGRQPRMPCKLVNVSIGSLFSVRADLRATPDHEQKTEKRRTDLEVLSGVDTSFYPFVAGFLEARQEAALGERLQPAGVRRDPAAHPHGL